MRIKSFVKDYCFLNELQTYTGTIGHLPCQSSASMLFRIFTGDAIQRFVKSGKKHTYCECDRLHLVPKYFHCEDKCQCDVAMIGTTEKNNDAPHWIYVEKIGDRKLKIVETFMDTEGKIVIGMRKRYITPSKNIFSAKKLPPSTLKRLFLKSYRDAGYIGQLQFFEYQMFSGKKTTIGHQTIQGISECFSD